MAGTRFDHCLEHVLAAVRERPQGQTEYALLHRLHERQAPGFQTLALDRPMGLYQSHFILFHCLYRLQDRLRRKTGEHLHIHCLRIALEPPPEAVAGGSAIDHADPLRAYYLDLGNLDGMDAEQVEALLSDFWRRLARPDRRRHALGVLGLDDPVDREAIRKQYRRLAQRHHPDRGGDTATFQRLQEAMLVLGGKG